MPDLLPYDEAIRRLKLLWREADSKLAACLDLAREQGFHGGDLHDIAYAKQHVGDATHQLTNTEADPAKRFWVLCERLDRDLQHERWQRAVNDGRRIDADSARDAPILSGHPHRIWIICPRAHAERYGFDYLRRRLPYGHALFAWKQVLHAGDDLVFAVAPAQ